MKIARPCLPLSINFNSTAGPPRRGCAAPGNFRSRSFREKKASPPPRRLHPFLVLLPHSHSFSAIQRVMHGCEQNGRRWGATCHEKSLLIVGSPTRTPLCRDFRATLRLRRRLASSVSRVSSGGLKAANCIYELFVRRAISSEQGDVHNRVGRVSLAETIATGGRLKSSLGDNGFLHAVKTFHRERYGSRDNDLS